MTCAERLDASVVHSVRGLLPHGHGLLDERPFRSPHHTVSQAALMGGGNGVPVPGEVSLAHRGVLFLDELPEFRRSVLECLRQPLESGVAIIGRVQATLRMPAAFTLVATMNPCPCGYVDTPGRDCRCTPAQIQSYRARVSGPLLDRIDLQVRVLPVAWEDLDGAQPGEESARVRRRVLAARLRQAARAESRPIPNARMRTADVRRVCRPDSGGRELLRRAMDRFDLSARGHDRVLKVARTIADLEGTDHVARVHVAEALQFRLTEPDAA